MRKVLMLSGMALVLASAGVASAQQAGTNTTPAPASGSVLGPNGTALLNLGFRTSWIDGDEARYERYRDLRDGLVVSGSFLNQGESSAFQLQASNVGYNDQQYRAEYNRFGKLKVTAEFNSIPLNYAYNTLTPWQDQGNNVWRLDAATRTAVQNKVAGVLGIGTNAAAYNQASVYRNLARPFEMQSRRDIIDLGLQYRLTSAVGVNLGFNTQKRGGNQPFGAAFAFNNANELPMSLDDRTTDMTAGIEWAKAGKSMLKLDWRGSKYDNEYWALEWDSPLRATDFANPNSPPTGPYDPSGYSNGNGPAFGRLALPPSNTSNTFSLTGLQRLSRKTTLNGQLAYTSMEQDEELIPWTTNTVINSAAVLAAFPHLAHLPRETAQGDIRVLSGMLNFVTRPTRNLAVDAKLRYRDRDNRTPGFDAVEYVRFDAVPEETGGITVAHDVTRTSFETGATLSPIRGNGSIRLAYILDDVKRTGRVFNAMQDNTFRVSFDTWGNRLFTVRGSVESTTRRARSTSDHEIIERLEHGGAQEALRFYDEAPLDRTAGMVNLQLTPSALFDLGLSISAGRDRYNDEGQEFGLLGSSNTAFGVNVNLYPADGVTVGGNFGYDRYQALQESRNANPFSGVAGAYESWTDVMRNWEIDNEESVKNFGLFLDLPKALPRTDIRLNYDQSTSDNEFLFGGPRIRALELNYAPTPGDAKACGATSTAPCFIPFAPVTNTWRQLSVDLTHMFNDRYGFSAGYSFDKLDIEDFATTNLADGSPRIDPLGSITTGYGNRPYAGQELTLRVIYRLQGSRPTL